ncbi:insulinase family protein [Candidatus Wolfebacteria bacterium]|nr:insulinase family protein [Candidatus Wolfebacteria bacterium]
MFKKLTLPNGLRIILAPKQDSVATTVLVLVEAGSKYEAKEINGLSHFLEHVCFKGTAKRPRIIDIVGELDAIGAVYNAFTSFEYTGYYAKAEPAKFDTVLDIVSDVYLNPVFNSAEIDKERGVIVDEISMYEDLPMRRVQEFFVELLYGDQPAGRPILGQKEVVKRLTRDDLVLYRSEHYLSQATIVAVAGRINKDEIISKIEAAFSSVATGAKREKVKTIEFQQKPESFVQYKKTDQTHLVLGVRAFDIFDERRYALEVLSDILGGGMSSRLFQRIREEMGVGYYVSTDADILSDHGHFSAAAGVHHEKIDDVLAAILHEFWFLTKELVGQKELDRAKEHFIGNMMLGLETSDALAGFYGGQEIVRREIVAPEEVAKEIRAVTAEEVMAVARDIFQDSRLNLALIGPYEDKERFQKILTLG